MFAANICSKLSNHWHWYDAASLITYDSLDKLNLKCSLRKAQLEFRALLSPFWKEKPRNYVILVNRSFVRFPEAELEVLQNMKHI